MSSLPKPILRGHMKKMGIRAVFSALGFATVNCCLFEFLYVLPKQKRLEEFYDTYDSKAHTRDLVRWGYFQTIRPQDLKRMHPITR